MSIWAPVSSVIFLIILPPGPMTSRILSGGILMMVMRGANGDISARGLASAVGHDAEDVLAPAARLLQRVLQDLEGDAADLDVHLEGGDARRACR